MTTNYELVVQGLTTCLFPPETIQRQKSYLLSSLFDSQESNIQEFICRMNNIID